jgi:hypothetical protein
MFQKRFHVHKQTPVKKLLVHALIQSKPVEIDIQILKSGMLINTNNPCPLVITIAYRTEDLNSGQLLPFVTFRGSVPNIGRV